MSRYLVTGGRGFIGRHLTRAIKQCEPAAEVVSVGRDFDLQVPTRAQDLFQNYGKFDYIFHLADVQGDARWAAQNAATQFLANTKISLNVLGAWQTWQPQARLIAFSSLWAYPLAVTFASEKEYWNGRLHQPTEHYGLNKKLLGVGLEAAKRQHKLRGTSLVLGSVYGPEDLTTHVIPSLLSRMKKDPTRLEIWGDGSETRDFIYIDDQIEGILRHRDYDGELLNIASGVSYSIRQVVETLVRLTGYAGEVVFDVSKASGAPNRRIDISLAKEATGWPSNFTLHSLEQGLQKTINSFNKSNG